jgi:hypothetical protein
VDENTGHIPGGGVAAHPDPGIAALLEAGSKTVMQAAHRLRLSTLENQVSTTNSSNDVLYLGFEISSIEGSTTVPFPSAKTT